MAQLTLIRHGETAWSRALRHTGRTDVPLTETGEEQARAAGRLVAGERFGHVFVSPLRRARATAELAGLSDAVAEPDLMEWDYGGYEGLTTSRIRETRPDWSLWRDGVVPGDAEHPGEQLEAVGARADRVLARVRPLLAGDEDVALVAHGHVLRVLTARWLELPPADGRLFWLATAGVCVLGFEREQPVVRGWNQRGA
ncbi:histidine phosphatase family protein [Yinghuangia sp. ASG 101]|uniref:histidine phosphatase family protein n=1 Tax=Yinghuangia sp. ASG 101 TaxID=2896848 RepID=UPI001E32CF11|nr:histidine phosphatase family protein [Yinghuangia sp. ASG 101]UGQ13915.1 histidine phosphatase family protein [Yinghuangia sp. ASG 101]